MGTNVHVHVEAIGDVVVVQPLQRRVTRRTGFNTLVRELWEAVDDSNANLLLDLSSVDFLCSAVLNELVVLDKRVKQGGGRWKICNPTGSIAELLHMTRLDAVFDVQPSREEALESLSESPPNRVGGVPGEIE